MNPSNALRPLALGVCCALLAACNDSVAELGVYPRQVFGQEGGVAPDGAAAAPANDGAPQLGPSEAMPSCLPTDCVSDELRSYPGEQCYELRAHAPDDSSKPYRVAMAPELYATFTMRAPGDVAQYLRSFGVLIGAPQVIHDMKLFAHHGALPEGVVTGSTLPNIPAEARLVYSWAPGADVMSLHPELGIALEPGAWYTLQAHYGNGVTGREYDDRSGFRVCATSTAPAHLVSFSVLGTTDIAGTTARGQCSPQHDAPIFMLAGMPRMNILGENISLTVQRAGGETQRVYDRAFSFDESWLDLLRGAHVMPGDTVATDCRYREEAHYGPGIYDETCELQVLHWPAGTLVSGGHDGSCLE